MSVAIQKYNAIKTTEKEKMELISVGNKNLIKFLKQLQNLSKEDLKHVFIDLSNMVTDVETYLSLLKSGGEQGIKIIEKIENINEYIESTSYNFFKKKAMLPILAHLHQYNLYHRIRYSDITPYVDTNIKEIIQGLINEDSKSIIKSANKYIIKPFSRYILTPIFYWQLLLQIIKLLRVFVYIMMVLDDQFKIIDTTSYILGETFWEFVKGPGVFLFPLMLVLILWANLDYYVKKNAKELQDKELFIESVRELKYPVENALLKFKKSKPKDDLIYKLNDMKLEDGRRRRTRSRKSRKNKRRSIKTKRRSRKTKRRSKKRSRRC